MIYKPESFELYELVYPSIYKEYKELDKLNSVWGTLDKDALITLDRLRAFLNTSITINDWHWGGVFSESGLRSFDTETGAELSQHKYGRGFDLKFHNNQWAPEKLRQYMKKIGCFEPGFKFRKDLEAYPFQLINRVEWMSKKEMSWFHFDTSVVAPKDGSIEIIWM